LKALLHKKFGNNLFTGTVYYCPIISMHDCLKRDFIILCFSNQLIYVVVLLTQSCRPLCMIHRLLPLHRR